MPLADHFHPPLSPLHGWESFHGLWASVVVERLNQLLPSRYFAAFQTHLGTQVEADVAEFERISTATEGSNGPGGVAVATWAPPAATLTLNAVFPDDIEVQVIDTRDGAVLVGVVEFISPVNKDRPETRQAFAAKCAAYLQRGIGLLIVDVVTNRTGNLHDPLVALLSQPDARLAIGTELYAVAYRPVRRQKRNQIDVWPTALTVGHPMPVLPLALRGGGFVPVDLEATYVLTRQRGRV